MGGRDVGMDGRGRGLRSYKCEYEDSPSRVLVTTPPVTTPTPTPLVPWAWVEVGMGVLLAGRVTGRRDLTLTVVGGAKSFPLGGPKPDGRWAGLAWAW